jgi:hypothetical protein
MSWEAVGSTAELIAAIAVLITLIFLTIQIRTNNELSRRNNRDMTVDHWLAWRQLLGSNQTVADIWLRGCRGGQLNESDALQFRELTKAFFLIYAIWESRARENGELYVVDIAVNSLVAELQNPAQTNLREVWLSQASVTEFNQRVKTALEA